MAITRRMLAGAAAGALLAPPSSRAAARGSRLASLDWSLTELALLLGDDPAAVSEAGGYRDWVREPDLPGSAADLGLRTEPNLELLQDIRPDLILTIPERSDIEPAVRRIAPTLSLPIYTMRCTPYANACAALLALGERIGAADRARDVLSAAEAKLGALRQRLGPAARRPVTIIRFVDGHTVFVFTAGGLFADMLDRLGIGNGFAKAPSYWGYARVPLVALAQVLPDTRLFYLDSPLPPDARITLRDDPLWRGLPFARSGSVAPLPTVWFFGAVGSALRFAELLTDAVLQLDETHAG